MRDQDRQRGQEHRPAWGPQEWATRKASGKQTLTMRLPPRADRAPQPVQRKSDPAMDAARAEHAAITDQCMKVVMRPDLYGEPVQRKAAIDQTGEPVKSSSKGGQAMPADVQRKMESSFGADFSSVSIHEGPEAAALGALAYTQGSDIHFAPGQYQPESRSGQELLGHELAHVVQQAQGRVQAATQGKGVAINGDASLEHEADEMGARAARGISAGSPSATAVPGAATGVTPAQCYTAKKDGATRAAPIQMSENSDTGSASTGSEFVIDSTGAELALRGLYDVASAGAQPCESDTPAAEQPAAEGPPPELSELSDDQLRELRRLSPEEIEELITVIDNLVAGEADEADEADERTENAEPVPNASDPIQMMKGPRDYLSDATRTARRKVGHALRPLRDPVRHSAFGRFVWGNEEDRPERTMVDPMPKMRTQLFKPNLLSLVFPIANLNCGWYSTKAILHHWAKRLHPHHHDQRVPLPGLRQRLGIAYDPEEHGTDAIRTAFQPIRVIPADTNGWPALLVTYGPILTSGSLGLADWGRLGGVGHFLIVVGVDTATNRIAYKDPLNLLDRVTWSDYDHFRPRITSLAGIDEAHARVLLPQLNPYIRLS